MKIAVIAAGGRSGRAFVQVGLAAGHEIRAGVREPGVLPPQTHLTEIICDAADPSQLRELLNGADCVVSLIGHVKGSSPDIQTRAIQNLISAMRARGLTRVVSLTGTGVRFPGDRITFLDHLLNFGITIIDPARVKDGRNHVEVLKASGLDWTVIRVLKLQNIPMHSYKLSANGPTKPVVGRPEVAQAILEVLRDGSFVGQAPMISHRDSHKQ